MKLLILADVEQTYPVLLKSVRNAKHYCRVGVNSNVLGVTDIL